jgi:hypothetical protein
MGVTNRDSSILTQKRRGMAENSYYTQWKQATMSNANPQQGLKAPAVVSGQVVSEITLGCTACLTYNTPQTDPNIGVFNPSSGGAGRGF